MCERITIKASHGGDSRGLERVEEVFGTPDAEPALRGWFMRDAEDELGKAGFDQETRICMGDVIRYTFVKAVGA